MAMEFVPPSDLDGIALVRMQDLWVDEYSELQETPGIPPTQVQATGQVQVQFGEPPRRIWATQPNTGLLLQTQADRLVLNWRKEFSRGPYPGYSVLREELARKWATFEHWLSNTGRKSPSPHLVEFTYVNQVEIGSDEGLSSLLTLIRQPDLELPGSDQLGQFSFTREVTGDGDNLFPAQISLSGQPSQLGDRKVFVFTVTCRVLPASKADGDPFDALDAAHALASHTFVAAVTSEKQQAWGRTQ